MSIRLRLIFILALLLGLMASQVFITLGLVSHLALTFDDINRKYLVQIERTNQIHQKLVLIAEDNKTGLAELDTIITDYQGAYQGPPDKLAFFNNKYNAFISSIKAGQTGTTLQNSYLQLMNAIDVMRDLEYQHIKGTTLISSQLTTQTFYLLSIVVILVTVIGIVFGWHLAHSFSTALLALITATEKAAKGDFSQTLRWTNTTDEFAQLAKSFNNMLHSLRKAAQENAQHHEYTPKIRGGRI